MNDFPDRRLLIAGMLIVGFLVLRGPVMYLQPGGQDEDCYAVPGLTILQGGLPRMPHAPARNLDSVFYRADEMLYSEPPLYFYLQACFYAILPDVYGTARLSSTFAGIVAAVLLYFLNHLTGGSSRAGLWTIGLFVFSRWFYFPAMSARPDLLCTLFGFAAILSFLKWRASAHRRWLMAAGVAIGAGGLTHPFALVYAIQLAIWSMIVSRGWNRLAHPFLLAVVAIAVVSLWIPLICLYPEVFSVQFQNQFLRPQEESLLSRLFFPGRSMWYHSFDRYGMVPSMGAWQTILIAVPLLYWTVRSACLRLPLFPLCGLAVSSIYLLSALVGPHHPITGYWSYPAGLMMVCTGRSLDGGLQWFGQSLSSRIVLRRWLEPISVLLIGGSMIPGSGLKALYGYLKNWGRPEYNAPLFAKSLVESLPHDKVFAVDTQFLLDFVAHHRKVLLLQTTPLYFRVDEVPFDYVVASRYALSANLPDQLKVQFIRHAGIRDDEFAAYVEIFESRNLREP